MASGAMADRLEQSLAGLEAMRVDVPPSGRHRLALRTLRRWNESGGLADAGDSQLKRIEAAHRVMWETYVITVAADRMRRKASSPFTLHKLQEMMGGGLDAEGKDVEPRNVQFELYVAALLNLTGLSVAQGEPDMLYHDGRDWVGVAAKRIKSMRDDQVARNVKKARAQIADSKKPGWIALNFDTRFVDVDPLVEQDALLKQFERVFDQANRALIEIQNTKMILGFMIFGHCTSWRREEDGTRSFHTAYPLHWVRWADSDLEQERFEHFCDLWMDRLTNRMERLESSDFEGWL